MNQILLAQANDPLVNSLILGSMFRFRHEVFHDMLGWEVRSENGQERDRYDELNPVYIVATNRDKEVEACWRMLPTTGSYMLKDTFPQLLHGEPAPQHQQIWELSRFAVRPHNHHEQSQVALNDLTFAMLQSAFEFACQNGIRSYVTVASVAVERLMKRTGISMRRFGQHAPQRIGKVLTVACWVDINEQTRQAVYDNRIGDTLTRVAA